VVFRFGESTGRSIRTVGALSAVGLMFVLAVAIGAGFGYLLDRWLNTSPWLFLLFFFFGVAAGILNVYRMSAKFLK
jgi:ATP synthase protein I